MSSYSPSFADLLEINIRLQDELTKTRNELEEMRYKKQFNDKRIIKLAKKTSILKNELKLSVGNM